jgi:hypothetical protein
MLLDTIKVYKHLYYLLFTDTKSRLIYVLYIRRVVIILIKLLTNCGKPAFYMLVGCPLFSYMLQLTSIYPSYLRMPFLKALNPFCVNTIELRDGRGKVRRGRDACSSQL